VLYCVLCPGLNRLMQRLLMDDDCRARGRTCVAVALDDVDSSIRQCFGWVRCLSGKARGTVFYKGRKSASVVKYCLLG
jgi:hypothetical protein